MFGFLENATVPKRTPERKRLAAGRARLSLERLEDRLVMSSGLAVPSLQVTPTYYNPNPWHPAGYTPSQIRHAYGFDQVAYNGAGQTIAIVDAYDDPYIALDLKLFDQTFGLPGPPQFIKATPEGVGSIDSSWAVEISLDVEWAHAIAPMANILLVEAKTNSMDDMIGAVDYARKTPGVSVVSMSWGTNEFAGYNYWYNPLYHSPAETDYDGFFTTPPGHIGGAGLPGGITFVASTGDNWTSPLQFPWPQYPSVSPNVLAVGGTTLSLDAAGNYLTETGWSGSVGGISSYESKPGYQLSVTQSSTQRTVPDVAYDANPSTGFTVWDSVSYNVDVEVGGTSAGAPQWAALVALADQGRATVGAGSLDGPSQTLPLLYGLPSTDFHDITSGYNGHWSAGPGYDLVTGRGSPHANLVVSALGVHILVPNTIITASTATASLSGSTISFAPLTQALGDAWVNPVFPGTHAFFMGENHSDSPTSVELPRMGREVASVLADTLVMDQLKRPRGETSQPFSCKPHEASFVNSDPGRIDQGMWEAIPAGWVLELPVNCL